MKAQFEKLYQGQNLSRADAKALFDEIFRGGMSDVQLASLLIALKMKGETPDEIGGAASAMVNAARVFPKHGAFEIGEIVGTGGDGQATINVSTTARSLASRRSDASPWRGACTTETWANSRTASPHRWKSTSIQGSSRRPASSPERSTSPSSRRSVGASAPQARRRPRPSNRSRMLNPSL